MVRGLPHIVPTWSIAVLLGASGCLSGGVPEEPVADTTLDAGAVDARRDGRGPGEPEGLVDGDGGRSEADADATAADGSGELPSDVGAEVLPDDAVHDDGDGAAEAVGETKPDEISTPTIEPRAICGPDGVASCPADFACVDGACVSDPDASASAQMVWVPSGAFRMGCNAAVDEACGGPDPWFDAEHEKPQHEVEVPAFAIDRTEVTVAEWETCVEQGPCEAPDFPVCNYGVPGHDAHPMHCANKEDAKAFCQWQDKRLATEAEWEKAARGGCALYDGACSASMPAYPWGDEAPSCERARYEPCRPEGCYEPSCGTVEVGSKPAGSSPYGAYEMAGNAPEWVRDCWHEDYAAAGGAPTDGGAWTESCDGERIVRGGGFDTEAPGIRTSARTNPEPQDIYADYGFRCARTVP